MQPHEQGTGHSARGQAEAGEPLTVDGMPVTEAAELPPEASVDGMPVTEASEPPPEAYDLTDYKPLHEPVTVYRRYGQGKTAPPAADDDDVRPATADEDVSFSEALRRQLANKGRPADVVFQVRCDGRDRHPLLWLVKSPWGSVPITRTSDEPEDADDENVLTWIPIGGEPVTRRTTRAQSGRYVSRFHGEDLHPGRPQTLGEWPEDRPLPPASCPCYAEVVLTVAQVRTWLASARPNATYRPPRSIV